MNYRVRFEDGTCSGNGMISGLLSLEAARQVLQRAQSQRPSAAAAMRIERLDPLLKWVAA